MIGIILEMYFNQNIGLKETYILGIPFFANTALGDFFFNTLLFGFYYYVENKFPKLIGIEK